MGPKPYELHARTSTDGADTKALAALNRRMFRAGTATRARKAEMVERGG